MKTPNIKFNLKFYDANGNEEVVRTLDDLREKCNLSDLYDYYESGVLGRWLSSIGQGEMSEALSVLGRDCSDENTARMLLRTLGLTVDDQAVADMARVKESAMQKRDKARNQHHAGCSKRYMLLMSKLLSVDCEACQDGTYSVSAVQECSRQCVPIIRMLLHFHEASFANYIESEKYLPWWVNLILWSCAEIRPYISRFICPAVHPVGCACCNGRDLFGSFLKVCEGSFVYYISTEATVTNTEAFCTENFGWDLDD